MTQSERAREVLAEENPEAVLLDGFDNAIIGVGRRCGQPSLAVYDEDKIIEILVCREGLSYDEAREHVDFNIAGAWVGEHTLILISGKELL